MTTVNKKIITMIVVGAILMMIIPIMIVAGVAMDLVPIKDGIIYMLIYFLVAT